MAYGIPNKNIDNLEDEEFYNLMQIYRHCPIGNLAGVRESYEDVKKFIREKFASDNDHEAWVSNGCKEEYSKQDNRDCLFAMSNIETEHQKNKIKFKFIE